NISLGKTTSQSSTFYRGQADNAVDGEHDTCIRTRDETDPWWRVDLLRPHNITAITITNRDDFIAEMIDGAEIHIGNSLENNGNNNPLVFLPFFEENAASFGRATQSSQWDKFGDADNAIDRKRQVKYLQGSCSHTKAETDPWWRVDLLQSFNVTSVAVTNRADCCSDRINGAEIHIGNSLENNGNDNPV
ncbi:hypothetical protein JZ751_012972, partial [Albula glossodonta]